LFGAPHSIRLPQAASHKRPGPCCNLDLCPAKHAARCLYWLTLRARAHSSHSLTRRAARALSHSACAHTLAGGARPLSLVARPVEFKFHSARSLSQRVSALSRSHSARARSHLARALCSHLARASPHSSRASLSRARSAFYEKLRLMNAPPAIAWSGPKIIDWSSLGF